MDPRRAGRRALPLLLVLSLAVLPACTANGPDELVFSGGPEGGLFLPLSKAMARAIETDLPGRRVKVIESPGSQANLTRVERGEAQLALAQNDTEGSDAIRTLAPFYREVLHFLAHRDSGIERFTDIRGRRVAVGAEGSGTEVVVRHLTRHYGLTYDDFEPIYVGPSGAVQRITEGQIDAMLFMTGLKSPACEEAVASGTVRFVGLGVPGVDQGEVAGFRLEYPFIEPYVIPVYTYAGGGGDAAGEPRAPTATLATRTLLVCHENLPDDLARSITESVFHSRAELIQTHQVAAQLADRFDPTALHFPIHRGAQAYYDRDKPSFFVEYAELMAFILSALIAVIAILTGLRKWFARHMKNRIDIYYERLEKILDRLEDDPDMSKEELTEISRDLAAIRRKAFEELIAERLLANESFRIFQGLLFECQSQVRLLLDNKKQAADATDA